MFVNVPWVNTSYGLASTTTAGLMSPADKALLAQVVGGEIGGVPYDLPIANTNVLGGITVGYTSNGNKFAVKLDRSDAYVTIPNATTSQSGLLSSDDKILLDKIVNGEIGGSEYELIPATKLELGGIKIGYTSNGNNFAVDLNTESRAYVTISNATNSTAGLLSANHERLLNYLANFDEDNTTEFSPYTCPVLFSLHNNGECEYTSTYAEIARMNYFS